MLSLLFLSLSSIVPVFGWIFVGVLVYRLVTVLQPAFPVGEKFVFYIGLPGLLLVSASGIQFEQSSPSLHLLAGGVATLISLAVSCLAAVWFGFSRDHIGVISQAGYRANLAVIGLALCANTYGADGLKWAAMPVAAWTLLFNVLGLTLLNIVYGGNFSLFSTIKSLLTNPMIVAILLGLCVPLGGFRLPEAFYAGAGTYAAFMIPFALVLLGGAIEIRPNRDSRNAMVLAVVLRLLLSPLLSLLICLALGVRGTELGISFLLLSGPVAMASHVMVAASGGDSRLAANIVVVSTMLAPLTISLGFFALKLLDLV